MSNNAVVVEGLSKKYYIGGTQQRYRTIRDSIVDAVKAPARRVANLMQGNASGASEMSQTFWALDDVSFEVKHGEVVGIIGRNGAGKSTLLKILSRITEPTNGRVTLHGRVGSLLEVGTGFHPELTGRENIYLNGAILGMRRHEIERKFDEIVAFAEIEKFIDTPAKHYSSGMYMRLAFAVAAHLEPEILIVDEVLAVGDFEFQKKCLGKMSEVAREGRTVLFVSHNMVAVESMCSTAYRLDHGKLTDKGNVRDVVSQYIRQSSKDYLERSWSTYEEAPGDDKARLKSVRIRPLSDNFDGTLRRDNPFAIDIDFWNLQPEANLHTTLQFFHEDGVLAFCSSSHSDLSWSTKIDPGTYRTTCVISPQLLNSGTYNINLLFVRDITRAIVDYRDILSFQIEDIVLDRVGWYGKIPGAVYPHLDWTTLRAEN